MTVQEKARKGQAKSDEYVSNNDAQDPSLSPLYRAPDGFRFSPTPPNVAQKPANDPAGPGFEGGMMSNLSPEAMEKA